ncbi:DUF5994 family protein [Catenuloplanes indicus]|uniref:Uncharacterized protein n=1 Tax=Catenuloplanes indicus TaxID=137267 RepID=A0AAE3VZT3_9ACTN|nr:DUF5994 family protein [Catenuloplanes indicus]MDQ0366831.1 hypothetical protein [Catenuloplanes indicus]
MTNPTAPRLHTEDTGASRTLLDGGWWPRSTDPAAEIPGLVLAIDRLHGRVLRLVLAADGWDDHPRRLQVAPGRTVRLGYFASQPVSLLTALCENGGRVDLLVVPPGEEQSHADAALLLATEIGNPMHAPQILPSVKARAVPAR